MPTPVLFLDIDGVLCTPLSARLDRLLRRPLDAQCFDPIALALLGRLVRRSGAQVVLSSSWRYGYADEGGDGLARRILGHLTARLAAAGAPVADIAPILGLPKGEEIAAWLAAHPAAPCAILDDRADEFATVPALHGALVLVDSRRGLRRDDCRRALALLAGPTLQGGICP